MTSSSLQLPLLGVLLLAVVAAAQVFQGTVYVRSGVPTLVRDVLDTHGAARGSFNDSVATTGWATLSITTSNAYADRDQALAAGYLEASLSQHRIWQYYSNFVANEWGSSGPPPKMMAWLKDQLMWVRSQASLTHADAYWRQAALVLAQFDGLVQGYRDTAPTSEALSEIELYMINAAGDVETLSGTVAGVTMRGRNVSDPVERGLMMDCSSLVKALPDGSNLFASQVTWRGYYAMLRVYKYINFAFAEKSTAAQSVGFASQPGFLSSKDDFYTTSAGLTVMETTNDIFNTSLYAHLTTQSVLCWMRSVLANRLADSGATWTATFARYNSGTYNNQWIVVDYKQFAPGTRPASDLVWILEQIPGATQSGDVTHVFWAQGGYWPSYNIPYFPNIYEISGYPAMAQKSVQYSYTQCARAQIFARNHTEVVDDVSMRRLMQYNDFQHDPLSLGLASNAIASRYDLRAANTSAAFGAIDAKNTCYYRSKTMGVSAISGPTHQEQTPFQWSGTAWAAAPHDGLPDRFDFDWQEYANAPNPAAAVI